MNIAVNVTILVFLTALDKDFLVPTSSDSSDAALTTTQQQLIKSRWLNLLMPMAVIGLILFLLIALLVSLSYHSIENLVEQEVEERLLESTSKMAQQLSSELLQSESLDVGKLDANLDILALYLAKMSVPWGGYSLVINAKGKLLVFPYQAEDDWPYLFWETLYSNLLKDDRANDNLLFVEQAFVEQAELVNALEPLRLDAAGLINVKLNNKSLILSWSSVAPVGWKLINVAAADKVFLVKNQIKYDYQLILIISGSFLVIMLVLIAFLVVRRDQQLAFISKPELLKEQDLKPVSVSYKVDECIRFIDGPLIICSFDAAGLIVACNTAFEHLVGNTQHYLKGASLTTVLGLKSLAINTQNHEVELCIGQQESISYWVSMHKAAGGEGLLLLLDISDLKQIQQQLMSDKQRSRLAAKMKAKFFQVAVSDANELLSELIKNARGFDANLTTYCQSKLLGVQHLLDDMRDMSDAGELDQQQLSEDALIVSWFIDDCYVAANSLLTDKRRHFLVETSLNIPTQLILDRRRLLRLIRHLLRQIIQLSAEGDIHLAINWNGTDTLQLVLQDQGGGLVESERLRRFQLTTPMSSSYESASGALGLGQLLTRQLVHEMRGSLDVEAIPTGGLLLRIELPARCFEEKIEHLAFGRILVVDDGPVNAMLASSVLEKSGYQVQTASSGAEALVLGQEKSYDLVLMDIFMPDMDGLETTRLWRQLSNDNATIPIIALTANTMEMDRQRFLQQGMDGYLAKPYRPNELRELVLHWLQKK